MNEEFIIVCPHCHSEIPRGASVCRGCQAEIKYGRIGCMGEIISVLLSYFLLFPIEKLLFSSEFQGPDKVYYIIGSWLVCYLIAKYLFVARFYKHRISFVREYKHH